MPKVFTLLKYLDRSKITAEAVVEIGSAMGRKIPAAQAAEIANAYKTRGMPGLLEHVPALMACERTEDASLSGSQLLTCPHCGHLLELTS